MFGTDGSGGPFSNVPGRDVVATLKGPLPGAMQTVPLAEAAMKMLMRFSVGPAEFCSDSSLCVKRLKVLKRQPVAVIEQRTHPRMWLAIKELVGRREVNATWVLAHVGPEEVPELWQYIGNSHADQVAGEMAKSLALRGSLADRSQLLERVDARCWKVQAALIQRYEFWQKLTKIETLPHFQGPKPATKQQLIEFSPDTCTSHAFRLSKGSSMRSECSRCGLDISSAWSKKRLVEAMQLPCTLGYQFSALGVHCSHNPVLDGGRVGCRQCGIRQPVHSFIGLNKFHRTCTRFRRY